MEEISPVRILYKGKSKVLFSTHNPDYLIQEYQDIVTAHNGKKSLYIPKKGSLCAAISRAIMIYLQEKGIETHLISARGSNQHVVKRLRMIPIEWVCRNYAAGSLVSNLMIKKGQKLNSPLVETYYKSDKDPLVTDEHIACMQILPSNTVQSLKRTVLKINNYLTELFLRKNMILVDIKLEFGSTDKNHVILGDEISPDNMRLWSRDKRISFDKDDYRFADGKNIYSRYLLVHNILL